MGISLILAASDNDVIGKDGGIPWFVRGEQAIFKRVTMGKPVIMGRLTHESLPKTLPGRLNIVVSRNPNYQVKNGGMLAGSLAEALSIEEVKKATEVFVIGGEQLFKEALPLSDRVYFTRVHTTILGGDKVFKFDTSGWKLAHKEFYKKNEVPDRPYDFEFQIWERN